MANNSVTLPIKISLFLAILQIIIVAIGSAALIIWNSNDEKMHNLIA